MRSWNGRISRIKILVTFLFEVHFVLILILSPISLYIFISHSKIYITEMIHNPIYLKLVFPFVPVFLSCKDSVWHLTLVQILIEDVMRAIHLKSFDYRVLNLLLCQFQGQEVNASQSAQVCCSYCVTRFYSMNQDFVFCVMSSISIPTWSLTHHAQQYY